MTSVIYLGLIFLTIIVLLLLKKPLYVAIIGGLILSAILYKIDILQCGILTSKAFTTWGSLQILLSLYLITFLQNMLDSRKQIEKARKNLDCLFHNRRVTASVAPLFIGLLQSAGAMLICDGIIKDTADGYLDTADQAFTANWFRHIPESTLPTYAAVLLMSNLSGVPLSQFVVGMLVPIVILFGIGYFFTLRKLPRELELDEDDHSTKKDNVIGLFKHLWSLLLIVFLILAFKLNVVVSVLIAIVIGIFVYHFSIDELVPFIGKSFEKKMFLNTFLVLVLKEFISYSGVLGVLPGLLIQLPIPTYLAFVILFFIGGIITGSNGIIALGTTIAFATITDVGMPLMVLLMCCCHAASLVSPTHVCLVIASDDFGIDLGTLIFRTLPKSLIFVALVIVYYNILLLF